MKNVNRYETMFSIVLSVLMLMFLSGCAGPMAIQEQAMKPTPLELKKTHDFSVCVSAQGGREKDPFGIPQVSNEQLVKTVRESIIESNLFSKVVPQNQDYSLDLFIVRISQPLVGRDATVKIEIAWTMRVGLSEVVIWQKSITTSATTLENENSLLFNRIVLATQEATRKNIEQGLTEISALAL